MHGDLMDRDGDAGDCQQGRSDRGPQEAAAEAAGHGNGQFQEDQGVWEGSEGGEFVHSDGPKHTSEYSNMYPPPQVEGESLCTVTDPNTQANGFTCYIHAYISGGPGEGREGPGGGRKGEDSVWSRACAMVGVRGS